LLLIVISLNLCGCLDIPYKSTLMIPTEKIYANNFSEGEANEILDNLGVTNYLVISIERNSRGTALICYFSTNAETVDHEGAIEEYGGALVISESACFVTNFPPGIAVPAGLHDDMTLGYWFQGNRLVFAGGQWMTAINKTTGHWSLGISGAPGNEVLVVSSNEDKIVYSSDPQHPLFSLAPNKDIPANDIFYQNNTIYVFGDHRDTNGVHHWQCWIYYKNGEAWQCTSRVQIPDVIDVLDFDPKSANVLCSEPGMMNDRAFIFNLNTKRKSTASLSIWRNHGFFLSEALVKRIDATLKEDGYQND